MAQTRKQKQWSLFHDDWSWIDLHGELQQLSTSDSTLFLEMHCPAVQKSYFNSSANRGLIQQNTWSYLTRLFLFVIGFRKPPEVTMINERLVKQRNPIKSSNGCLVSAGRIILTSLTYTKKTKQEPQHDDKWPNFTLGLTKSSKIYRTIQLREYHELKRTITRI